MRTLGWPVLVATLVCLIGCLGDPVGPGGTLAIRRLSPVDSVLVGAPGRPLPTPITFQSVDADGRPVPYAAVGWTVAGTDGRVDQTPAITDSRGEATVLWFLGTKASEDQRLTVQVAVGKHHAAATVAAIAKPVEVSSLAFSQETTTVELGVATQLVLQATDPFHNHFTPEGLALKSLDTALARVDSALGVLARGRGYARLVATAGGVTDTAWLHVTQVVQAIHVDRDTLRFHSIGQGESLAVMLVDERGLPIRDSVPLVAASDTTIVDVHSTGPLLIQSVGNGVASVRLQAGPVSREVVAVVRQRTASLAFRTGFAFAALGDTARSALTILDSLGVPVAMPYLTFASSDTTVATIDPAGLVTARGNGSATMTARSRSGAMAAAPVNVTQQVATITVAEDSLQFHALTAALPIRAVARDRLGSPVPGSLLSYVSANPAVASVSVDGIVRAVGNGTTFVATAHGGDTASVVVRVTQRPIRVSVSSDTVRFAAFGETRSLAAIAVDSLGSPVPGGATGVVLPDTTVVALRDSVTVRSRGNGTTNVGVTVAGLTGHVVLIVDQVPTTLTAAVAFGSPVVTLPAGVTLPLICQALDKNGFAIARDPTLVGSLRGTVTGTRCSDARIQRSGYDTLFFALESTRARVPVIVATAPDSVGVVTAAQPLTDVESIRFVGEDLGNPSILALRPLVQDILAAYGNPTTNLGRARAIRDWVARTAVYPVGLVHLDGSTSNLSVLPPGKNWADVNATLSLAQWDRDANYWIGMSSDGYAILDRLLGTLDRATGLRADDGLMEHVAGAHYRMRDLDSYRYFLCTYQTVIANALWAAAGLHSLLVQIPVHEPAAVFIPELGKWVYQDVSFSNEYLLDGQGEPLSALDLLALATAGMANRARATKLPGPSYDPQVYAEGWSYMNVRPEGMVIMGSRLYMYHGVTNPTAWTGRFGQIDVPALANHPPFNDPAVYPRVTDAQAFPALGVVVGDLRVDDSVFVVRLATTYPNHQRFERRLQGGTWQAAADNDILPVGACRVEYRSVDAVGNVSASAVLDVWAPRGDEFIQSGDPGGLRRQASRCT